MREVAAASDEERSPLKPVRGGIETIGGEEFRRRALLDDPPAFQHDDPVGVADRGGLVRDDQARPFADVGPIKFPDGLRDEQVLFLSDILPTAYQAALNCEIEPGDTVAIWGCGPVGLLSIKCADLLGAERVIAIDRFPERLRMAREKCNAEIIDYERTDVREALKEITGGRGPDACLDAVGLEAHGPGILGMYDRAKTMLMLETDRAYALRQAI